MYLAMIYEQKLQEIIKKTPSDKAKSCLLLCLIGYYRINQLLEKSMVKISGIFLV